MSGLDLSHTSGYYSNLSLNNRSDQEDQIDHGSLLVPNLERTIFDQTDNKRPPYTFCCCNSRVERSLVLAFLHYFILIAVFTFCILFLTLCENDNKISSGIVAILLACIGHVLHGPKL